MLVGPESGSAAMYSVIDLGTLPGGAGGEAMGLNDNGQVVGFASTTTVPHAFLYSGGVMKDLGTLSGGGNPTSTAFAINSSGEIVGESTVASPYTHAFVYANGMMTDLGTFPFGHNSSARAVNGGGQIAGFSDHGNGYYHAFLYSGGVMKDLGTLPGGLSSDGLGINLAGQVVGGSDASTTDPTSHAFLYSGGVMKDLNSLISPTSGWFLGVAREINDLGQITGGGSVGGQNHGFLFNNGALTDLTLPGGTGSNGVAINAGGQVTGNSYTSTNRVHAILYSNSVVSDLNSLIAPGSGWELTNGLGINDLGQIAGYGP
jgi:probable HAF family extracellular repeat protein